MSYTKVELQEVIRITENEIFTIESIIQELKNDTTHDTSDSIEEAEITIRKYKNLLMHLEKKIQDIPS